ncbi:MAG: GrpB family protein [Chloroflexi bacterium]|nr:GrpB family protein [Chloroflexota bacterium]MCI0649366.1 GrpB family protein [Chloroflexota bacterium]MCI0729785.1 GrpB family protein [Chloroflexota bacterium]
MTSRGQEGTAVEIVDYQERWPGEFEGMAAGLRRALGELVVRIDHIGSTSVPGLAAKDRIDAQVAIASWEKLEQVRAAMEEAGYFMHPGIVADHRPPGAVGPDADWEKRLFKETPGQRPVNFHVRLWGRPNSRYALLFRDYLRARPDAAAAYAELKRRLAAYLPQELKVYAIVKDPACDLIMQAAEMWAVATGWKAER